MLLHRLCNTFNCNCHKCVCLCVAVARRKAGVSERLLLVRAEATAPAGSRSAVGRRNGSGNPVFRSTRFFRHLRRYDVPVSGRMRATLGGVG